MAIQFQMVSPSQTLLSEEVDSVTLMTGMGEITILPGHIPVVATLRPGEVRVSQGGDEKAFVVFGGFVQIQPGNSVIVLADEAERVEDLIVDEVEKARDRAEKSLKESVETGSYEDAALAFERETARLRLAKKYKSKGYRTTKASNRQPKVETES